jgi:hypothetical protein
MARKSPPDVFSTDEKPCTGCLPMNGGVRPLAGVIN